MQKRKVFTGLDINLQESWLNGSNLYEARLEKANLWGAQLHGAFLAGAQLHGASSYPRKWDEPFETVINKRIGKQSDLSGAIYAGGLTQEAVDCMCNGLSDEAAKKLREGLEAHVGEPEIRDLPENSGADQGSYTKEEADQWIAEYKTALSAVSESG